MFDQIKAAASRLSRRQMFACAAIIGISAGIIAATPTYANEGGYHYTFWQVKAQVRQPACTAALIFYMEQSDAK